MANEFIARKGIISLDSIQVSGSISATGGITISGSISSASFATTAATASSADNFFVRQNLTASSALFTGSITAQTLVVQTVTSSIVYSSGSNIFGNQLTDTQRFTGSVLMTGSLNVTGPINSTSTICSTGNTCFGGNTIITGCLGIGTNTPTRKLTIDGSGGFSAATGSAIRLNNTTSGRLGLIDFDDSQNFNIWSSTDSGNIRFFLNSGAGTERMRIDYCGNVGIGYTPCVNYGPLQVKSPASTYTIDLVGRTSGLNGESQITFWNSGQTVVQGAIGNVARCMVFYAGGTEVMRMTCGGNMLIGSTDDPGTRVSVRGVIASSVSQFTWSTFDGATDGNLYITANAGSANTTNSNIIFRSSTSGGAVTERMRITSDGVVSINCNGSFGKGAKLQILQGSSNTNALDFKNTDATYGHIGTFANNLYLTQNYYYAGGQNNDSATYGQAAITMGVSNVAGDTSIDFSMSDPGATSPNSKMRLFSVGCGVLLVGTTTCTAEASLVLGAKGTIEGGQLVLQKGTSCSCATHLDNYQNTFRIMSGTDTGSTMVNMVVNHVNGQVGIGLTPSYQLDVQLPSGTNGQIIRLGRSAGAYYWSLGIDSVGSCFNFYNNSNTSVAVINPTTGVYTATSDCRVKSNITDSCSVLDKILQVKVRQYIWNESCEREDYGLIAQEVNEVLPQYVKQGDENTNWGVSKSEFVPALIKAIQEQQCQICTQSIIIDQLKTCLGII